MPKRSPLSLKQWADIQKRLLGGEAGRALAREFGVSETAIRKKFGAQTKEVKTIGEELFQIEAKFKELPLSSQVLVRTFADDLHAMNLHMAGAGKFNSATAHRLSGIAHAQVDKIDCDDPMQSQEILQAISALLKISNDAASIPLGLIKSNTDVIRDSQKDDAPKEGISMSHLTISQVESIRRQLYG